MSHVGRVLIMEKASPENTQGLKAFQRTSSEKLEVEVGFCSHVEDMIRQVVGTASDD
jgi:hypothetical protein